MKINICGGKDMDFDQRRESIINKTIARTIWENEKGMCTKIIEELLKQEPTTKRSGGDDPHYYLKNDSGNEVTLYNMKRYLTNKESTSRYQGTLMYKSAYIKINNDCISYEVATGEENPFIVTLGSVYPDKVDFPMFGDTKDFEIVGQLPKEEIQETILKTIEESVTSHPILGENADFIINDFKQILSICKEIQITPMSDEAIQIAKLSSEKEELVEEVQVLKDQVRDILERVKKVPFLGKRIFRDMSTKLPQGRTVETNIDRKKFAKSLHIDVSGISGIKPSEKSSEQVQTIPDPDSEIED